MELFFKMTNMFNFLRALSLSKVEAVPPASLSPEAELEAIEREYRLAEEEFSRACVAVVRHKHQDAIHVIGDRAYVHINSMRMDSVFAEKCNRRATAMKLRNELLSRRASLLKRMGKIS